MSPSRLPTYRPSTPAEFAARYPTYGSGLLSGQAPVAIRRRVIAAAILQTSVALRAIAITEVYCAAAIDGARDALAAAIVAAGITLDRGDHGFAGVLMLDLMESFGLEKELDAKSRPVTARALSPFTRGQVYRRQPGLPCPLDRLDLLTDAAADNEGDGEDELPASSSSVIG